MGVLEPGDIDEALNAASAIGDDRIQMQSQGYVVPDSFTHGTSEQRSRWFNMGFQTGDSSRATPSAPTSSSRTEHAAPATGATDAPDIMTR